jgi:hypothetical protein
MDTAKKMLQRVLAILQDNYYFCQNLHLKHLNPQKQNLYLMIAADLARIKEVYESFVFIY